MLIAAKLTVDIVGTIMTLQAFGKVVGQIVNEDLPSEEELLTAPLLHLHIMKEMSLCKLVDTDYPFLIVCAPTYSVEFYIHLFHFLCIATYY